MTGQPAVSVVDCGKPLLTQKDFEVKTTRNNQILQAAAEVREKTERFCSF